MIYVDELVFTKATVPRCEYASVGNNICINERDFYHRYLAVVAAISIDRGVDAVMIFDQAVNKEMFVDFLHALHKDNKGKVVHVFMDNLQVHRTELVRQQMAQWKMQAIWNVPYRFDFQPIELVFS